MKAVSALVALTIGWLVAGCVTKPTTSRLGWIQVSADKSGFVDTRTGKSFTPWGFNYDRDYKMRLLEDYWETEWATVVEDFREMKALGANVVRIHLQLAKFMTAPDKPNAKALARLGKLLQLAEETGLHLDLTGLACYRKADVPAWFDAAHGYTANPHPGELYDLSRDLRQRRNLYAEQPAKVAELQALLAQVRARGQVR